MYPNLSAEMARNNIKPSDLSESINISYDSIMNKLNGKTDFTRFEIFEIKNLYFPNLSLDYLFQTGTDKS